MAPSDRPKILCVDDEPRVLEGLSLHLRKHFDVATAPSGAAGLESIRLSGPYAVVMSDMRMPEMDGTSFLKRVRADAPESVRVLLTGQADLESAVAVVNEGQIFRFLLKPCPPETLIGALQAAASQHRLITAEKVLLQETLLGSIKTLTDVLSLAHPTAFGRATRLKRHVSEIAEAAGHADRWSVEAAAMLSQLGSITLPPQVIEKLYHGEPLTDPEQKMAERLPAIAEQLLGNIPRLEPVREILRLQSRRFDGADAGADPRKGEAIPFGARALKLAQDFDALEAQGADVSLAFDTMRGRDGAYDPVLLEKFASLSGSRGRAAEVHEMNLAALRPGMIFAEDVRTKSGGLLVARGQEVTDGLLERMRHFTGGNAVKEPIRVIVKNLVPAAVA